MSYIVGIDLGTTNTVVAFARLSSARQAPDDPPARPRITVFDVPQLVAAGEVAARSQLPSFRYHPTQDELADADTQLGFPPPLPELPRSVTGVLAQALGSRVPGRLVASAKSWLCHAGVDRQAAILPCAGEEVRRSAGPRARATSRTCARPGTRRTRPIHWPSKRSC